MLSSNPSAPGAAQNQSPETQQLVALLGSLLPLLQHFQSSQTVGPQFGPSWGPNAGFFSGPMAGLGSIGIADPALDHQAAVNLIENMTADALRTLSTYLETNARNQAALESCVGIVTQAARCFAARDYTQAFNHIWQAYRLITMAHASNPQLPPLRSDVSGTPSAPPTGAAVH
jgi:hypothetical protein